MIPKIPFNTVPNNLNLFRQTRTRGALYHVGQSRNGLNEDRPYVYDTGCSEWEAGSGIRGRDLGVPTGDHGLGAFIFVKLVSTIQLIQVILAILGGVAGLTAL